MSTDLYINRSKKSKPYSMEIRSLVTSDWSSVRQIYELGIATGIATFESTAPTWESWDGSHLAYGRLVALSEGRIVGWVALSAVSDRCVYGGVAEVSVYVDPDWQGRGVGSSLLRTVIEESESNGIWTLNAAMFPQNKASIQLHKKVGFRVVGYREKIARQNGVWMDNVILERRSQLDRYL